MEFLNEIMCQLANIGYNKKFARIVYVTLQLKTTKIRPSGRLSIWILSLSQVNHQTSAPICLVGCILFENWLQIIFGIKFNKRVTCISHYTVVEIVYVPFAMLFDAV